MKTLNRISALLFVGVLTLLTTGCASLGLEAPKSFMDRAVVAQISVTTVRSTALALLNQGTIGVKDAKNAQAAANDGNEAIDLATSFYTSVCPTPSASCTSQTADAKLAAAVAILTATQTYLNSKGTK